MKGLLMVLHGSPRPQANEPILRIAARLRDSNKFDWVEVAYLECNLPTIDEAVTIAVNADVTDLTVVPVFLHPGRHVGCDIPAALHRCQQAHVGLKLKLGRPVGHSAAVTKALLARAGRIDRV